MRKYAEVEGVVKKVFPGLDACTLRQVASEFYRDWDIMKMTAERFEEHVLEMIKRGGEIMDARPPEPPRGMVEVAI